MKKYLIVALISVIFSGLLNQLNAQSEENLSAMIFVEGNYLRNLGTYGTIWPDAKGAYIGYGMHFPDRDILIFKTGYFTHSYKASEQFDGSLNIIPFHIGGRYYFFNDQLMPFVQFMNGLSLIFQNMSLNGVKEEKVIARYFWQIGIGGTYSVSNKINLDIGINYNSAFYDNNKTLYHEAGAMMTGFEYTIGVGWKINN